MRARRGWGGGRVRPLGPGFGHGSVTVLVTIRGLPQSHSITLEQVDSPVLIRGLSHSITLHHPSSTALPSFALLRRGPKDAFLSESGLSKKGFALGCLGNVC